MISLKYVWSLTQSYKGIGEEMQEIYSLRGRKRSDLCDKMSIEEETRDSTSQLDTKNA
jgi:hypothetical protein